MMFTLEIYKTDKRAKAGKRLIGKYDYDRRDRASMEREIAALHPAYRVKDGYEFIIVETFVTRTNMMTGKTYQERYDTPCYMSASSETYWSM